MLKGEIPDMTKAKNVGLYLRPETERELVLRGENRSHIIARDLDRLYTLYRRAIREVPLTEKEACLIVDSLNGTVLDANTAQLLWANIEDSVKLEGLADKWEVDGPVLVEKFKGLSAFQAMALADAAERFWEMADGGKMDVEKGVRKVFNISD